MKLLNWDLAETVKLLNWELAETVKLIEWEFGWDCEIEFGCDHEID